MTEDFTITVERVETTITVEETPVSIEQQVLHVTFSASQLPPSAIIVNNSKATGIAAQTLSALRAVWAASDGIRYASSDAPTYNTVLGLTVSSANPGSSVEIQTSGEIIDAAWNWTPGLRIYLGLNGQLTQTPAATGLHVPVAVALSPTQIWIRVEDSITLEV